MSNELITIEPTITELTNLSDVIESAKIYASHARAANTNRAYRSDWNDFTNWCNANGIEHLPAKPSTVALYLSDRASSLKTASLARRLTAIRQAHQLAGMPLDTQHPAIRETWKGIRNTKGIAQTGKLPILTEDIRELVALLPNTAIGIRDKALILFGFAGAFRRSELVSLMFEDLSFGRDGLTVHLRKSKTDQEGRGREIGIPYGSNPVTCPIRAIQNWLQTGNIQSRALFRGINRHGHVSDKCLSDKSVALIIKRAIAARALAKGLSDELSQQHIAQFAGHSLRAGFATSAAKAGAAEHSIMRQTGHKKADTLRKYIRMGTLFTENAAAKVGL